MALHSLAHLTTIALISIYQCLAGRWLELETSGEERLLLTSTDLPCVLYRTHILSHLFELLRIGYRESKQAVVRRSEVGYIQFD